MGWNSTTKIMTAPLNLNTGGDVQQATGVQSGDLGTCIQQGNINKWARYKPQRGSQLAKLTNSERSAGNWGFSASGDDSIRKYTYADILAQAIAKSGEWIYAKPRGANNGGGAEYFRMFDFLNGDNLSGNGYWKDAPAPFSFTFPTNHSATPSAYETSLTITRPTIPSSHSGLALTLSDFLNMSGIGSDLADYYFGVIFKPANSAQITHVQSTTKVSQLSEGGSLTIPLTFPVGSFVGCVIAEPANFDDGDSVIYLPGGVFSLTYSRMVIQVHCSLSWYQGTPFLSGQSINLGGGFLKVNFTDATMPTSGQPYVVKFMPMSGNTQAGDEVTYDPTESIPSLSSSPVYIDVSGVSNIPVWEGMTATAIKTWIEATGLNTNGEQAVLLGSLRTDQL